MRRIAIFLIFAFSWTCAAQDVMQSSSLGGGSVAGGKPGAAAALYHQLRDATLDPAQVYQIREAPLDRDDVHLVLEDGTIAFLTAVDGRITGALFSGTGEVLLRPPSRVERTSLEMFTGAAILEETFDNAFLRFNDDTAAELKEYLRPADDAAAFVTQWNQTVHALAESDTLRLIASFLNTPQRDGRGEYAPGTDHLLHARLQGTHLGVFDVFFDTEAGEPVAAGGLAFKEGVTYFDEWTSFRSSTMRKSNLQQPLKVVIDSYRVRASVEPPQRLSAETEVRLKLDTPGQRIVYFELSRFLKVSSVELDGQQLEFLQNEAVEGTALARRGNDFVGVVFPQAPPVGKEMTLKFTYSGDVLGDAGGGLLYVGARGDWYPARGMQMSRFDLEFRYPEEWTLVATGTLQSERSEGPDKISHWVSARVMPLAGFNLGRYQRIVAQAGPAQVAVYAAKGVESTFVRPKRVIPSPSTPILLPNGRPSVIVADPMVGVGLAPEPQRNSEVLAAACAKGVDSYAQMFGPFPYASLALTQNPGHNSQGWPGLVFLSSYAYLSPSERTAARLSPFGDILYSGFMQLHETAHQWWGDLIAWRTYRDQWLMEALANYSALMVFEKERPADARFILDYYRDELTRKGVEGQVLADAGPVTLGSRLSNSHFPNGFDAVSYGRGAWLLHMLHMMMLDSAENPPRKGLRKAAAVSPEDPFLRGLRKVRQQFEGGEISTEEFLHVMENELPESARYDGKKSLDWFLDGWVNGDAIPSYKLDDVKFLRRTGGTVATAKLLQRDAPPDLVTSVPIYAVSGSRNVYLGRVFADGPETTIHFAVPTGVRKLLVDPYGTVLTKP